MDEDIATAIREAEEATQEITLADIAARLDAIGQQLNWLVDNLASLFAFVQAMGNSGGGIRGLMKAMKAGAPELKELEEQLNAG